MCTVGLHVGSLSNAVPTTIPDMQFLKSALLFAAEHKKASLLVPLLLCYGADIDAEETQVSPFLGTVSHSGTIVVND